MKVVCKVSDKLTVELEGADQKDTFEKLATVQEVFGEDVCGKCGKSNLKFQVRTVDDNKFYEIKCVSCGAVLSFGAHKKGNTLFPKRKDGENWLADRGWVKWDGSKKS
jgi:hypothetical protein